MTSQNKKKKARNSYFHNGYEKSTIKLKRAGYYNKRMRNKIKSAIKTDEE